jgi:hypothetical protein
MPAMPSKARGRSLRSSQGCPVGSIWGVATVGWESPPLWAPGGSAAGGAVDVASGADVGPGAGVTSGGRVASSVGVASGATDGQVTVTYITGASQDDQRLARYSASGTRISDMAVPGLTGSRLTILAIGSSGQIAAVHNRRVPDTGDGSSQRRLVVYRTAPAGLIGSVTGLTQSYQEVLSFPIHPLNRIRGLALTQDGALLVVGRTEDLTSDVLGGFAAEQGVVLAGPLRRLLAPGDAKERARER